MALQNHPGQTSLWSATAYIKIRPYLSHFFRKYQFPIDSFHESFKRLSRKVDFNHNLWWRILLICSIHKLVFFVSSVQNFLISLRKFSLPDSPRGSCRITISQQIVSPCFFSCFKLGSLVQIAQYGQVRELFIIFGKKIVLTRLGYLDRQGIFLV